ncbi:unnamed protein product (macronuclear) [Paramecium tetraurelia]|uniref:DUF676 domain-containing protein n=1 Tax=Paramecium tetraurelia TaxID=5888 RepID=A0D151_PARTE|nr:uncharacterized protein GSPATT00012292001 [Paramecium tetraurelia]CAK76768.1 unnamed protein product [Paramecium tetraurelia]|eukprot:XP_001444165.1 hypothetical protein (macronuclear) [Paramecium tetraurelia strain d4-2]
MSTFIIKEYINQKTTIFQKSQTQSETIYAQPYMTVEKKKFAQSQVNDILVEQHKLLDTTFYSKAFIIKYCDQIVDLNEGCVFRIEVQAYPEMDPHNIYCIIELLFCELSTITQEDFKIDKLQQYQKCVAKFESRLHNIKLIKEFVSCQFDESHFCQLKLTIHSVLVDFKYHQNDLTLEQFMSNITNKFKQNLVSEFYAGYNKILLQIHEQLESYYQTNVKQCISDEHIQNKFGRLQYLNKSVNFRDFSEYSARMDELKANVQLQEEFCNQLFLEVKHTSSKIFVVWYQFIDAHNFMADTLTKILEQEYTQKIKERWGESIFQHVQTVEDLSQSDISLGKNHKMMAKQYRNNNYYKQLEPLNIEDLDLFPEAKIHPIVFRDVSRKQEFQLKPVKGLHLLVFVHGYQGNSYDMRLWRNNMAIRYPDHLTLLSKCNEDNTDTDILVMGEKLALEVKRWIKEWCPKDNFSKLSFIGHSLGGIIIRAALPHLSKYKDKMFTYLSLGSPHLSYTLSSSKVVDTGLWFIRKWKKCICLNQLTLNDSSNPFETCLYKLSTYEGLGWFTNIALMSSYQDTYSPFESARIQRPKGSSKDAMIINKMIDNIMKNLSNQKIDRLDVNYELVGKSLDTMIGRAAHIAFIDNSALIKLSLYSFDELFD